MTLSRSCVQFAARVAVCLSVSTLAPVVLAAGEEYRLTDPALEVVPVDSSPRESFLSMRADATGRLFVGGREAVASAGAIFHEAINNGKFHGITCPATPNEPIVRFAAMCSSLSAQPA